MGEGKERRKNGYVEGYGLLRGGKMEWVSIYGGVWIKVRQVEWISMWRGINQGEASGMGDCVGEGGGQKERS